MTGPTTNAAQLRAEEPEGDQSSGLCRQILAALEQHHQEMLQRFDNLATGRRVFHSSGNASLDLAPDGANLDGANLDMYFDSSAEMGNTESPTSPPDNDVLGHGDGMSPGDDSNRQELCMHPGDSIPLHDSIPLWPPDTPPQSDNATVIRMMGPTRKIVHLGAEEPEADQSSVFCRPDMHLDGPLEMGNDLFGTHMGLKEIPTTPPDNDVPGHGGVMSPSGEVNGARMQGCKSSKGHGEVRGATKQGRRPSRDHGEVKGATKQGRRPSRPNLWGDGGDSEDSDDRQRRLSALLQHPSVGLSSMESAASLPTGPWCRRLRKILHSTAMEVFIVSTILANSLLLGVEVQYAADYPDAPTKVFINLNMAFTLVFLVELLARTWVDGLRRFRRSKDWAWNVCDLLIVITSLAEALMATWVSDTTTPTIMRVFRIARVGKALGKVLRIQRLIRYISALRTLVYSIFVTLRSLVWALLLLLIIMYIFGVIIAEFSVEHLHQGTDVNPRLMKFWGSLWVSMLTLFQAITGGISWYEVTDPLSEVSGMLVGVFIMYIFLITFAVFNVITGIFCHSAIETAVRDPELGAQAELQGRKLYIQRVKKLFHEVDEDGSGVICLQELESVVKDETVRAYFAALDLDLSDAWTIFKLIAGKRDVIDQDTFVKGCLRLRGSARRQDCIATLTQMEALVRRFSSFAKMTMKKMESMSAPDGLLQKQKQDTPRILKQDTLQSSLWSQSVDSATK